MASSRRFSVLAAASLAAVLLLAAASGAFARRHRQPQPRPIVHADVASTAATVKPPPLLKCTKPLLKDYSKSVVIANGLFLHWNITDAKDGIIAALEAKKGSGGEKGWLSIGWSGGKPGGRMMFPSDVVVGNHVVVGSTAVKPTDVLAYSMTKDNLSGIKRTAAVILSDTSVVSVGGGRIIKFTRKGAGGVASQAVSYESGVTTTMIWAFSTTPAFKTHTKKGAFSVNLGCTV